VLFSVALSCGILLACPHEAGISGKLRDRRRLTVSVKEILQEAIQGEVEAHKLYMDAVALVQAEHVKDTLRELAQEELGHKAALERMLANPGSVRSEVQRVQEAHVQDYKIADHLIAQPLGPDSSFQDVCIFAAKKEQQSYEMYRDMAAQNEGETRELLAAMAKDELRHKNLVEAWYEEIIYQEF
jgi:rubrerythrin